MTLNEYLEKVKYYSSLAEEKQLRIIDENSKTIQYIRNPSKKYN